MRTRLVRMAADLDEPTWVLLLLGALFAVLLPTGYSAAFFPWFVVEMAGAVLTIGWFWRGKLRMALDAWRIARFLSAWLGLSAAIAAIQIAAGNTESRFETFRQFHFFAGAFLAVPLAVRAFSALLPAKRRIWVGASASALLVVLLTVGMYRSVQLAPGGEPLVWWPFVYRNHYAAFVLLAAPALCWQVLNGQKARWSAAAGVAAGLSGVISSGSRSGIVLLALALLGVVAAWAPRTQGKRRLWGLGLAAAVLAAGTALANPDVIAWRLKNAGALLDGRADYWRATLQMVTERPWLGWGFGTWPGVYTQFLTRDDGRVVNHAHSDWLEYLAEGGPIPFLALAALCVRTLWLGLRHPWSLGVPALLLFAMVDYPLRLPIVMLALVCLYAGAEAAERSLRANKASSSATFLGWLRTAKLTRVAAGPAATRPAWKAAASVECTRLYSKPNANAGALSGKSSLGDSGMARIILSTRRWYARRRLYTLSFSGSDFPR